MYPSSQSHSNHHHLQHANAAYQTQFPGSEQALDNTWAPTLQMNGEVYPTGVGLCPVPIRFELGQFTGLTIRAGLTEIQKADLGRKYVRALSFYIFLPLTVVLGTRG